MKKENFIAILEIGSEKFVCSAAKKKDDKITILAVRQCYSKGLEKGSVISIQKAAESIKKVVEEVEIIINKKIEYLFIGIRGEHIHTDKAKGVINIARTNKEITEDDKSLVLQNIYEQINLDKDRTILEIVPIIYTVDTQKGIIDPKGMDANHLQLDAYIITASSLVLNNIYKAINNTGFKVLGICYNQIALANNCLLPEEQEIGVALIDIGSKLTDISVYKNNRLFFTKEIILGGDLLVNDIAFGLKTSLTRARNLIENYGFANPNNALDDEEINFYGVDGITKNTTTKIILAEIINARLEEICKIIDDILTEFRIKPIIPSGIVLTGGTAKLKFIQDTMKDFLDIPIRIGTSQDVYGDKDIIADTAFSSSIGIITHYFKNKDSIFSKQKNSRFSFFPNFKKYLEGIF
ncbi:MAG: cell division protein FtsA [Elusimicrobiota bacterium]|jgi:cell division protein FtsA|nr:cell division protein FtsA [Elusimicrobiota bacterium]